MNVTREVITDLLPAYLSGEASADTRRLVEEYFRQDVAFEREFRRAAEVMRALGPAGAARPDALIESAALKRAKRMLQLQTVLLAVASTFSLNAVTLGFSFEVEGGHTTVHWLTLPGQTMIVLVLLVVAAVFWIFYFRLRRRIRARVLG